MGCPVTRDEDRLSLEAFLASKGITPHQRHGDYQDYIEKKQKDISPRVVRAKEIPIRGSIHLALGKIMPKSLMESKWLQTDD